MLLVRWIRFKIKLKILKIDFIKILKLNRINLNENRIKLNEKF